MVVWMRAQRKFRPASRRTAPANAGMGVSVRRCFGLAPLLLARAGQDSRQCVVALVAGVLEYALTRRIEGHFAAPWTCVESGVVDSKFIENFAGRNTRQPLRDFAAFAERY